MLGKYVYGNCFKIVLLKRKFYFFIVEKRKVKVNIVFYSSVMEGYIEYWRVDDLLIL